ncbi:hypothetical protein BH10ACT8_BH10ACT8_15140 [soil metagenome]|jgi:hypothetical protein
MSDYAKWLRRHNSRLLWRIAATVATATGTLMICQGVASATPGGPGAIPPHPIVNQNSGRTAPRQSGNDLKLSLAKEVKARAHWSILQTQADPSRARGPVIAGYTSRNLGVGYQAQINDNYCGPATTAMIAAFLKYGWSGTTTSQQNAAARLLGTNTSTDGGTNCYGPDNVPTFPYGSWYPVADTLDYQIYRATHNTWYTADQVSGAPTSSENTSYKQNLTFDVDANHPMALNQYSVAGYQFSYQTNQDWAHWLVARGYSLTGGNTFVNDPGFTHGNNATVPSVAARGSVLEAVGGHGYIW